MQERDNTYVAGPQAYRLALPNNLQHVAGKRQ
jgi:hypothetical protein